MQKSNGIDKVYLLHNCPLCSSYNIYLVNRKNYSVGICRECFSLLSFKIDKQNNVYDEKYYLNNYVKIKTKSVNKFDLLIRKYFSNENRTILDYGAGTGDFAAKISNINNKNIIVYDQSAAARNFLEHRFSKNPSVKVVTDVNEKYFDDICMFDVIAHVDDPQELLIDLTLTNLKPCGRVFVRTPIVNKMTALLILSLSKLSFGKLDGVLFNYKTRSFIASRMGIESLFHSVDLNIHDFYYDQDPVRMSAHVSIKNLISFVLKRFLFLVNKKNSIVHTLKFRK